MCVWRPCNVQFNAICSFLTIRFCIHYSAQYNRSGTAPKNLQLTMSMPGYLLMFQMSTPSFTISYPICYLSICRITSLDLFILHGFLTLCLHFMLISINKTNHPIKFHRLLVVFSILRNLWRTFLDSSSFYTKFCIN